MGFDDEEEVLLSRWIDGGALDSSQYCCVGDPSHSVETVL